MREGGFIAAPFNELVGKGAAAKRRKEEKGEI